MNTNLRQKLKDFCKTETQMLVTKELGGLHSIQMCQKQLTAEIQNLQGAVY